MVTTRQIEVCGAVGLGEVSNSSRIVPSDYQIVVLLEMPLP